MTVEMPVVDGLRAMRALIADPDRWTQGALARDRNGFLVSPRVPEACQWCLEGAFYNVADYLWPVLEAVNDQLQAEGWTPQTIKNPVAEFNDTHTHPEALALLDRTIAAREEQAA